MNSNKDTTPEEVITALQKFTINNGRLPRQDEEGFEKVIKASIKCFGSLECALDIAGLIISSKPATNKSNKQSTLKYTISQLIDCHPMTIIEIRHELGKTKFGGNCSSVSILNAIKTNHNIKGIGPRRNTVYFLSGQETLAETHLTELLEKSFKKQVKIEVEDPIAKEILKTISYPLTRMQLLKILKSKNLIVQDIASIDNALRKLQGAGLIYIAKFSKGKGSHFSDYELFGDLQNKTYFARTNYSNGMIELLADNLFYNNIKESNFHRALMSHLRRILPTDIFTDVELNYTKIIEKTKSKYQKDTSNNNQIKEKKRY